MPASTQGGPVTSKAATKKTKKTKNDAPTPESEAIDSAYEPGHEKRKKALGHNPCPSRKEDYIYSEFVAKRRAEEHARGVARGTLPQSVLDRLRKEAEQEVTDVRQFSEDDSKMLWEWGLTSSFDDEPDERSEWVVHAAVMMLPHLFWLLLRLMTRTGGRGPEPKRRLIATTIMAMAFKRGRPEIYSSSKQFEGSQALANWAWRFPRDEGGGPTRRAGTYEGVHEALSPKNIEPELVQHIQVQTFKEFAAQIERYTRAGKAVYKHPKAGVVLVADGSFTEGQTQQTPYVDEEHRQIRVRHRTDKNGIHLRAYLNADGKLTKMVVGYKDVELVCLTTGRSVISMPAPANAHEPDVVLELLERLFTIWPEAPVQFLVGDALYAHGKAFIREVMFRFGIDCCFPWRADFKDPDGCEKGVPVCDCSGKAMTFKQRKGKWWGPKQRATAGMSRLEWCPAKDKELRYEYKCSLDNAQCRNKSVQAWKDPRVHCYLPHAGEGRYRSQRRIFLYQRNIVESHYAAKQRLGMQGQGVNRPAWANDVEVCWMLGLGSTFLTARRLVFENGLYDRAHQLADDLELLDDCSETTGPTIAPGATVAQWEAEKAQLMSELPAPAPPASWTRRHGGALPNLRGSARTLGESWGLVTDDPSGVDCWEGWQDSLGGGAA